MRNVLRWLIENIAWRWLARIDRIEGLENLPPSGAAILMINHIAFIDPIVVLGNLPRNIVPLAKRDVYRIPVWGIFPRLWNVIPVDRGGFDRAAVRSALQVLEAGEIVLVAPEGTRHDALKDAKEGIAYLAYKADAPIIPVAIEGTQGFPSLSRQRWAQPGVVVRLGRPIRLKRIGRRPDRNTLRQMTDECLYALARMLPDRRRGEYADLSKATTDFIKFA
ncbi:MAG: lysophospholipid acyltransferase family protein [Anaerolineales bacterium]